MFSHQMAEWSGYWHGFAIINVIYPYLSMMLKAAQFRISLCFGQRIRTISKHLVSNCSYRKRGIWQRHMQKKERVKEMTAENKKKRKTLYAIFTVILIGLFIMITCPPIVQHFDRNDIWVGPFPLSQFYIFIVPFTASIAMAVLYFFDKKLVGKGDDK